MIREKKALQALDLTQMHKKDDIQQKHKKDKHIQ